MPESAEAGLEVRSYFVRGRNALIARADFSELYVDYYLHLADQGRRPEMAHDELFKRAIAALTLHCASRPRNESVAWTIHLQDPLLNIFVAGNNRACTVIGHLFTEQVKSLPENLLYSDVDRGTEARRRSVISFEGADPFRAVERLYEQSEQRPARYFQFGPEDFVMITAQPDCDVPWLAGLNDDAILRLDETEAMSLLEQRRYRWECGCNQQRIFEILAPSMRADPEGLFEGEETLRVHCPRCGVRHAVTREAMEAFVSQPGGDRAS